MPSGSVKVRLSESQEFLPPLSGINLPHVLIQKGPHLPCPLPHQPTAKHLPPCSVPLHFTPLQRDKRVCRCRNQLLYMACSHLGCKNCPSCAPQPEDSSGGKGSSHFDWTSAAGSPECCIQARVRSLCRHGDISTERQSLGGKDNEWQRKSVDWWDGKRGWTKYK